MILILLAFDAVAHASRLVGSGLPTPRLLYKRTLPAGAA
jgi:hypothetical protein